MRLYAKIKLNKVTYLSRLLLLRDFQSTQFWLPIPGVWIQLDKKTLWTGTHDHTYCLMTDKLFFIFEVIVCGNYKILVWMNYTTKSQKQKLKMNYWTKIWETKIGNRLKIFFFRNIHRIYQIRQWTPWRNNPVHSIVNCSYCIYDAWLQSYVYEIVILYIPEKFVCDINVSKMLFCFVTFLLHFQFFSDFLND